MKRHYLIMTLWLGTIFAADQISQEELVSKVAPITIPSTLLVKEGQDSVGLVLTADLHGNAATATYAEKAANALQADHALKATQAEYAICAVHADKAVAADQATSAERAAIFTEPLSGDVTGNQNSTVVTTVGGQGASIIATAVQQVQSASVANVPNTLIMRDEQGNCAATIITADLQGNAATATYALKAQQADYAQKTMFALQSDMADQAKHAALADQAVQSDKAIQADQATCAACANIFTEPLVGDVTGNQTSTVVSTVGGQSASTIAAVVQTVQQATSECANNALIVRDAQGDFSARHIKANLLGNATTATHANTFNKALDGDVVGKQFATVVKTVGGQPAADIACAVQSVQAATPLSTPNTIILRDAQGDFIARVITADLQGNATTATSALKAEQAGSSEQATYAVQADAAKHAMQADKATVADQAHQSEQATCAEKANYALQAERALYADHALSADKVLQVEYAVRSSHADYASCAVHADKAVVAEQALESKKAMQAAQAACAECAALFTEPLSGDVTGNQASTVVHSVGGQSASTIAAAVQNIQAATTISAPNTLVLRDAHGDFAAHIITADLQGNAATATQAEHAERAVLADQATSAARAVIFTESLSGDVTGSYDATVVSTVGGCTAIEIAAAVHKMQTTSPEAKTITITTDAGVATPNKAAKLFIRGSQNIKVRASDASIVISLNPSPSVTGSLTAGTTITAGTGLQVVSGGAAITGDTHINIAGQATTTFGNASSSTICNGPLCLKYVHEGIGAPLGIDADGNVIILGSDSRTYSDKKMHALLRALVAVISEQQKKIEHIEYCINNG